MRSIYRLLGGHPAAAVAFIAVVVTIRVVNRVHVAIDPLAIRVVVALDAALVAWAVWDEVTRWRQRHADGGGQD